MVCAASLCWFVCDCGLAGDEEDLDEEEVADAIQAAKDAK